MDFNDFFFTGLLFLFFSFSFSSHSSINSFPSIVFFNSSGIPNMGQ